MKHTPTTAQHALAGLALAACFAGIGHAAESAAAPAASGGYQRPPNWNDTYVGACYADGFYFPGNPHRVAQKIATLNTAGGFKYGGYIFNADYLVSDKNNLEANGSEGARDIYTVSRISWSAGKILGRPMGLGVIRDVGLMTGYELNAKNDHFGSAGRIWMVGPSVEFALPRGFWSVTGGWAKESNHNGIAYADVVFKTAWHAESAWLAPLQLGAMPAVFKGFVSVTGPKGRDGFHAETRTETLMRAALMFDVGALAGHPRTFYAGPGYEYWNNMYGVAPATAPGTRRSAVTLNGEIHF